MAAHRYWRFLITAESSSQTTGIYELRMRESVGGTDIEGTGTYTATSEGAGSSADDAFDNNETGDAWQPTDSFNAEGEYVTVDFGGTARDIAEVGVYRRSASVGIFTLGNPLGIDVQYSDDNSSYTTLDSLTINGTSGGWEDFTMPGGGGGGSTVPEIKVLRGSSIIPATNLTLTLTESTDFTLESGIASSAWFFRITNNHFAGMGRTSGGGNQNLKEVGVTVSYSGDNVVLSRYGTVTDCRVDWEIWQYVGSSGGDNEFIVRDKDENTTSTTTLDVDLTAISASNIDDVVPFITGQTSAYTARNNYQQGLFTATRVSNDIRFQRGDSGTTGRISYALVEFTGANWTVTEESPTRTASTNQNVTLSTTLSDYTKAFIIPTYRYDTTATGGIDDMSERVRLISNTQLNIWSSTTNDFGNKIHNVWIIQNPDMTVTEYTGTMAGTGEEEVVDISITAVASVDSTAVFISNDSTGAGTALPRGYINVTLQDSSTVRIRQSDNGQTSDYSVLVVEFPEVEESGGETFARTASVSVGNTLVIAPRSIFSRVLEVSQGLNLTVVESLLFLRSLNINSTSALVAVAEAFKNRTIDINSGVDFEAISLLFKDRDAALDVTASLLAVKSVFRDRGASINSGVSFTSLENLVRSRQLEILQGISFVSLAEIFKSGSVGISVSSLLGAQSSTFRDRVASIISTIEFVSNLLGEKRVTSSIEVASSLEALGAVARLRSLLIEQGIDFDTTPELFKLREALLAVGNELNIISNSIYRRDIDILPAIAIEFIREVFKDLVSQINVNSSLQTDQSLVKDRVVSILINELVDILSTLTQSRSVDINSELQVEALSRIFQERVVEILQGLGIVFDPEVFKSLTTEVILNTLILMDVTRNTQDNTGVQQNVNVSITPTLIKGPKVLKPQRGFAVITGGRNMKSGGKY